MERDVRLSILQMKRQHKTKNSHNHKHIHTHTHLFPFLSPFHKRTYSLIISLSHKLSILHTHTLAHVDTLAVSHTHSHYFSFTISLSATLSHKLFPSPLSLHLFLSYFFLFPFQSLFHNIYKRTFIVFRPTRCQFHQRSTSIFYACRSQKRQMTLLT